MEILNKHPLLKRSMPTSNKNMYNHYNVYIVHKAIVCINNNYYVHICILLKLLKLKFIAIKVKVGP